MNIEITKASVEDLKAVSDIYNFYVLNSTCTYQIELETINDRRKWFDDHNDKYPVITAWLENEIAGWASLSQFRKREGYKPTVENSIYIKNEYRGKGIGSALLTKLIELAKTNGYHSIIAGISADQEASIRLHLKFNFIRVAFLKEVGYKFGKWLDAEYYQLILDN